MGLETVDLTNQNQVIATWKVRLKKISTLAFIRMKYQLNLLELVIKQSLASV